jgi:hypothetical protein
MTIFGDGGGFNFLPMFDWSAGFATADKPDKHGKVSGGYEGGALGETAASKHNYPFFPN